MATSFTPDNIGEALSGFAVGSYAAMFAQIMFWVFIALIMFVCFAVIYVVVSYRIKIIVFEIAGTGNPKNPYTIQKKKWDRAKLNKDGSWTWMKRDGFFNMVTQKRNHKAFPKHTVFPGNMVLAFKSDHEYFPGTIDMSDVEAMTVMPIDYDIRKKAELEMQQIDIDLQKQDWWSQGGKQMMMALGFSLIVIAFAGFVIWLAFKKTDQVVPAMDRLVDGLKGFGTVPGE